MTKEKVQKMSIKKQVVWRWRQVYELSSKGKPSRDNLGLCR